MELSFLYQFLINSLPSLVKITKSSVKRHSVTATTDKSYPIFNIFVTLHLKVRQTHTPYPFFKIKLLILKSTKP